MKLNATLRSQFLFHNFPSITVLLYLVSTLPNSLHSWKIVTYFRSSMSFITVLRLSYVCSLETAQGPSDTETREMFIKRMVSVTCHYRNKPYDTSFMLYEEPLYPVAELSRKCKLLLQLKEKAQYSISKRFHWVGKVFTLTCFHSCRALETK